MASKGFVAKAGRRGKRIGRRGKHHSFKARHGRRIGARRGESGGRSKFNIFGVDLVTVGVGGAGAVLSGMATNYAAGVLPLPASMKTGPGKLALRAGLTLVAGFAAKKFAPRGIAGPFIAGSLVGLGIDVLQTFVMPHVPAPAMSGYEPLEQQLAALELAAPGTLNGLMAIDNGMGNGANIFSVPNSPFAN